MNKNQQLEQEDQRDGIKEDQRKKNNNSRRNGQRQQAISIDAKNQ